MKFGRRLREQSDAFDDEAVEHAVDYKQLKKLIGRLRASKDSGEDVSDGIQEWLCQFNLQVQRFDSFFCERVEELRDSTAVLGGKEVSAAEVKDLYVEAQELKFFGEMNRTGFRKILKKLDKNMGLTGTAGSQQEKWKSDRMHQLAVSQKEADMECILNRLADAFCAAQPSRGLNTRRAQQELDYHVSCVSDLFAYMLSHEGKPGAPPQPPGRGATHTPQKSETGSEPRTSFRPAGEPVWPEAEGTRASPLRSLALSDDDSRSSTPHCSRNNTPYTRPASGAAEQPCVSLTSRA